MPSKILHFTYGRPPRRTIKALGQTVNNNVKQISRTLGGWLLQAVSFEKNQHLLKIIKLFSEWERYYCFVAMIFCCEF
jgi:hypothetical protein